MMGYVQIWCDLRAGGSRRDPPSLPINWVDPHQLYLLVRRSTVVAIAHEVLSPKFPIGREEPFLDAADDFNAGLRPVWFVEP